ncbi:hypothetical protein YpsIP31758_B0080 (plasmid) [Yersinia pseudotuberculosis IP 31758]|uniref:PAAR domain-containing protein n=2 Tax=Yersinia TaxID=629 RepID=A0A0U1QTL3_YERP3|nr:hypothetical protein YpsIP31758_B0080 [Yersinia pseudotuberculosis IP 31758]
MASALNSDKFNLSHVAGKMGHYPPNVQGKSMEKQYTNELSAELLASMDISPFSAEELSAMTEGSREQIEAQEAWTRQHPVNGLWRFATERSRTRLGGVVVNASSPAAFQLDDGSEIHKALVGDCVVYPDGRRARIISGAGDAATHSNGVSFALVGSVLDNGDEIVSTPQSMAMLVSRDSVPMPDNFLVPVLPALC